MHRRSNSEIAMGIAAVMLAAGALVSVGCGDDSGRGAGGCTPGATTACSCADGRSGSQACAADGSGFGACMCTGALDSGTAPTDGGPAPMCNPLHNWNLTVTFGAGDCGWTGTQSGSFTVTDNPSGGFIISESDPTIEITGTITDVAGACRLSATEIDPDAFGDGTTMASTSYNLTADTSGSITGSGSVSLSGGATCSQTFTVTGMFM